MSINYLFIGGTVACDKLNRYLMTLEKGFVSFKIIDVRSLTNKPPGLKGVPTLWIGQSEYKEGVKSIISYIKSQPVVDNDLNKPTTDDDNAECFTQGLYNSTLIDIEEEEKKTGKIDKTLIDQYSKLRENIK